MKTMLEKTARSLSAKIKGLRSRINAVKEAIVGGCKKAVAAFRDTGVSALNNLAGFFHIKEALKSQRDGLTEAVNSSQASVAKIEAAAEQYHSAGRALKNILRAIRGQEPIPDIKPNGKLARLIETPYRTEIAHLNLSLRLVNKALAAFDRLEKSAAKAAEAERPSARETMKQIQKQIDTERQDAPAKTKVKTKEEQVA
jgi:ABC-type transporter Mla subunit MlaD